MKYNDFCQQMELRERKPRRKDNLIAEEVISEYLKRTCKVELSDQGENSIEDLLYEYFSIKESVDEKVFLEVLDFYHFNYSMSIHNAIYYLLATKRDHIDGINPLLWPGVYDIKKDKSRYILDTTLGTVEVYQASDIFSNSKSFHIFKKDLTGQCYERSYDFLCENHDYQAVLSYMPNFFYGGHYHAYLEKGDEVLDIASNALYDSKESIDKILYGEVIAKLTYKEVQQKFNTLKNTIPNVSPKNKLLTLALYYDRANIKRSGKKI